jgi:hypothetical protein
MKNNMKKLIIFVMLLGVVTLHAKPKYRIQSWVIGGTRMYLPQQKVWYRTNYFPLPFKIWMSGDYPFQNKEQAEEIIKNWSQSDIDIKKYKNTEFFYIK